MKQDQVSSEAAHRPAVHRLWAAGAGAVELEPPSLVERRRPVPPSMPALLSPVEGERPPWRTQTPCQFARDGPQRPVLARGRADVFSEPV